MKKNLQLKQKMTDYKTKRMVLLSTGEIIDVKYPLNNTLLARNKAILVLDEEE